MDRTKLPPSLVVVAVLFIMGGVAAVVEMVVLLMNSHISVNLLPRPLKVGLSTQPRNGRLQLGSSF
jgi:hypothetical protein